MSHVNTTRLIAEATHLAYRADYVRQDPAVIKSAKTAVRDISHAARSTADLAQEISQSWIRSGQVRHSYTCFSFLA